MRILRFFAANKEADGDVTYRCVDLFNSQWILRIIRTDLVGYCCIILDDEFAFNLLFFSIYLLDDSGGRGDETSEGSEDNQTSIRFYLQAIDSDILKDQLPGIRFRLDGITIPDVGSLKEAVQVYPRVEIVINYFFDSGDIAMPVTLSADKIVDLPGEFFIAIYRYFLVRILKLLPEDQAGKGFFCFLLRSGVFGFIVFMLGSFFRRVFLKKIEDHFGPGQINRSPGSFNIIFDRLIELAVIPDKVGWDFAVG